MQLYAACNAPIWDQTKIFTVNKPVNGDNHIQNVYLGCYKVGYTVRNHIFGCADKSHKTTCKFQIIYPTIDLPKYKFWIVIVKPDWSSHSQTDNTKVFKTNDSLIKVKSIAECSPWSILQYFWSALSNNRSWKPIFGLLIGWPLKTGFTVSTKYVISNSWAKMRDMFHKFSFLSQFCPQMLQLYFLARILDEFYRVLLQ